MSDTLQWAVLLIAVPVGVWFAARAFAEGFKEGWNESREERRLKREAREAAKGRHPSSGVKPWAPDDARELCEDCGYGTCPRCIED